VSKIYNFINEKVKNKFNPTYNFFIYEDVLQFNFQKLKQDILNLEKTIIKKYSAYSDGNTGLGNDSLTSRFRYFNLLQIDETRFLKDIIRKSHNNFLNTLNYEIDNIYYVQCWANVMRRGEQIKEHHHGINNYSYLGGHICVHTENTNTHYVSPYYKDSFPSKNEPGKITLFPNWLRHYTDKVISDLRITIAFDMINEESFNEDIVNDMKPHWEKI